jgi:hypothetical protein
LCYLGAKVENKNFAMHVSHLFNNKGTV